MLISPVLFYVGTIPISVTLVVSMAVSFVLVVLGWWLGRNLNEIPTGKQHVAELVVLFFKDLLVDMLGDRWRGYYAFVATIGIYVAAANLVGVLPGVVAPTSDLSIPAALAFMVFLVAQSSGIRTKGLARYLREFIEPMPILFPLNLIGTLVKPVSHAFRLFGNMVGGVILIGVISQIARFAVPVPLLGWFNLFMGAVQAFVFTLLAAAYIGETMH